MKIGAINSVTNYQKNSLNKLASRQTSPVLRNVGATVQGPVKNAVGSFTVLVIGGVIAAGLAIAAAIDTKINSKEYSDKERDDFIDDMLRRSMHD